jgi:IS30 family transposase
VSHALGIAFFSCHPYHSWEKGTVEPSIENKKGDSF